MVVSFIRPRLRSLTDERENLLSLVETQVSSESVMYYFGVATGNLLVVVYSNDATVENFTGLIGHYVASWLLVSVTVF